MSERLLEAIREIIQEDVGHRGLRTDPSANLVTACSGDLAAACRSLAAEPAPVAAIITGFLIPHAEPPVGETDGPLGALFLAKALTQLGARVVLATDGCCVNALKAGLTACGLGGGATVVTLPAGADSAADYWDSFVEWAGPLTHLVAIERVGPSHTPASVAAQPGATEEVVRRFAAEVPAEAHDRCYTMGGRDITAATSPAHLLFEAAAARRPRVTTVAIGDGGNELGMGKVPWEVIRRNIPGGAKVACRVPADHLVVSGVSNWGAYGLAAGLMVLRGRPLDPELFNPPREEVLLQVMVERGPLVDGISGRPTVTVDGLSFDRYIEPLRRLRALIP